MKLYYVAYSRKIPMPFIYKLTNKVTCKYYVGKSEQAFCMRWKQLFTCKSNTKISNAIEDSNITDWTFEVLELIDINMTNDILNHVLNREAYWIVKLDSINKGYNVLVDKTRVF